MASLKEYTDEQLNYYRICYLTTDILAEGLREIFKQEWDKLYKTTKGEWKDEPRNGMDFYNGESPRNQKRNAHLLATMKNGNSGEWDCTMLFYAILFSDCVGSRLSATVRRCVDDLRNFKNEEFAHVPQGRLSEMDFQNAISKVEVAFLVLGLPIAKIQDLRYQKTFPTNDLAKVLKEVDNLKQEVQQLKELINSSDNILDPGSDKSQLAGLVAKRFFDDLKENPGGSSFPHGVLQLATVHTLHCLPAKISFFFVCWVFFLFTVYILVPSKFIGVMKKCENV